MHKTKYEFDGEKYKAASKHQKYLGMKIVKELNLYGAESILDLGCGDGALTQELANLVPQGLVLGIDASEGMLAEAKKIKQHNLKFQCMDINAMNFSREFDLIFSSSALHWVKDHTCLYHNALQALKPGGIIYFSFAGAGTCETFIRVIKTVMLDYPHYFKDFEWPWYMPDIQEYEKLVRQQIISEVNIWPTNADRNMTENEMIRWIDQPVIVPFLIPLPEHQRPIFRDQVVETMLQQTRRDEDNYFETFRRINVFARKLNGK